jgi:hypothetical protein
MNSYFQRFRQSVGATCCVALVACGGRGMAPAESAVGEMAKSAPSPGLAMAGSSSPAAPPAQDAPSGAPAPSRGDAMSAPGPASTSGSGSDAPHNAAMLVYTARLSLGVYKVEAALAEVERLATQFGGYLSVRKDDQIVIRVPREKFLVVIAAIEKTGDVLHRDIQAEDVTFEFTDLEIRIKNARAMRDRLVALLDKAQTKDAIEIEKELGRVTEELERLTGRMKLLQSRLSFSTITVDYSGKGAQIAPKVRLPFPWLYELGVPGLLNLREEGGQQ